MAFESEGTRVEQVMAAIRQRIAGRALQPGAKAPSIRALSHFRKTSSVWLTPTYVSTEERS